MGVETCAADGLFARFCPVGIDSEKFIKEMRSRRLSPTALKIGQWTGNHLQDVTTAASLSLAAVNIGHGLLGSHGFERLSDLARSISFGCLPKWTSAMPEWVSESGLMPRNGDVAEKVLFFPSCIARSIGPARNDPVRGSIPVVTVRLLEKAGYKVVFPEMMKKTLLRNSLGIKGFYICS